MPRSRKSIRLGGIPVALAVTMLLLQTGHASGQTQPQETEPETGSARPADPATGDCAGSVPNPGGDPPVEDPEATDSSSGLLGIDLGSESEVLSVSVDELLDEVGVGDRDTPTDPADEPCAGEETGSGTTSTSSPASPSPSTTDIGSSVPNSPDTGQQIQVSQSEHHTASTHAESTHAESTEEQPETGSERHVHPDEADVSSPEPLESADNPASPTPQPETTENTTESESGKTPETDDPNRTRQAGSADTRAAQTASDADIVDGFPLLLAITALTVASLALARTWLHHRRS